jgi:CSLREA domain-containing protein
MNRFNATCVLVCVLGFSSPVNANNLIDRGNGLIYDTDLDVTFQQNANLAATETFDVSGIDPSGWMTWSTANAWIAAMNAANYLGYNDWRLPQSGDDPGYKDTSEMGHLYYLELAGVAAQGYGTSGPFTNLPNDVWTSHTASWNPDTAFFFSFGRWITPGYQTADWKETSATYGRYYSAWAVRTGDSQPNQANTITVNTFADEVISNATCSLREAILAVNKKAAVGGCPAGTGDDTIIVPAGDYTLSITGADEDLGYTGDLDITASVTIQGAGGVDEDPGNLTVIDANGIDRVFHIRAGTVTINDLIVQGGHIVMDYPRGCWAGGGNFPVGGGIAHFSTGTTILNRLTISDNEADLGNGGIDAAGPCPNGGGVLQVNTCIIEDNTGSGIGVGAGIQASVSDSIIRNNTVSSTTYSGRGGGINQHVYPTRLTVINSTINGNTVDGIGGGILSFAELTVIGSTIADNQATQGGGIWHDAQDRVNQPSRITNSTISGNQSDQGGGLYEVARAYLDSVTITNNTATNNTASGGGVFIRSDLGGTTYSRNSIIAGNTDLGSVAPDCFGSLSSQGYNLIGDITGCGIVGGTSSDITNELPLLGPLADNGGPTDTHTLFASSPAIDAGDPANCPGLDQRTVERPLDGDNDGDAVCDIGAYEYEYQNLDTTPPNAAPTQSPSANGASWNNSDVTVTWNWADNAGGSGIDSVHCTTSSTSVGEGTLPLNATCKDLAGNEGSASYTVKVDKTKPTITAAATTTPNGNGWYNSNVTVQFTCTDGLSGIPTGSCPADQVLSDEGAAVASTAQTVTDGAGNTSYPSNVVTVQIDRSAPTASPSATPPTNADGWRKANATVTWIWTDSGSGVDTTNCTATSTSSGEGTLTLSANCTDRAGNTGSASYTVKIDKTAPTISITTPSNGAVYNRNANVTASYACTDELSGVSSCTGTLPDNALIDTTKARKNQKFTVDATDNVGNKSKLTYTYSVK